MCLASGGMRGIWKLPVATTTSRAVELTSIGCDPESSVTGWRQTLNCRSERYRSAHDLSIAGDSCYDLGAAHEPVRICAVVCPSRKRRGPIRGDKSELFPAVLPCSAKAVTALDHQVLAARFSQETRHSEPDVTRPYDQNIDGLRQRPIDLLWFNADRIWEAINFQSVC